ncbi:hypothetical protein niasHT_029011 [Heterodera trifolii]|uniref:Uncharacterized protein n=1 Tax=Heterodera trifolii TaxID=157864 RepID=A0ABD2KS65_9BILA
MHPSNRHGFVRGGNIKGMHPSHRHGFIPGGNFKGLHPSHRHGFVRETPVRNRALLTLYTTTVQPVFNPKKREEKEEKQKVVDNYRDRVKKNFDRGTWKRSFDIGQKIFARNFRDGTKWMEGEIVRQISPSLFLVRTKRGIWKRHLNQLKSNETETDSESAETDSNSSLAEQAEMDADGGNQPDIDAQDEPQNVPTNDQGELRRSSRQRKPRTIFDPSR